jgi:hypothetical protein
LLEKVRLGLNALKGTISDGIGGAPNLKHFSILGNQFTGRVPTGLARPDVNTIRIKDNRFSGTLDGYNFPSYTFDELLVANTRMYGRMPQFGLYENGKADVKAGESLGNFIANGESCAADTSKCSSGETSCAAVNRICCAPYFANPNVRVPCASGVCNSGTGACVVMAPSRAPTLSTGAPIAAGVQTSAPSVMNYTPTPSTNPQAVLPDEQGDAEGKQA